MTMKLGALDIETGPALVWAFTGFKPFITPKHIEQDPRMICFTWQWIEDGETEVLFFSEHTHGRRAMLQAMRELLDEADAITTYNGKKFDDPWIRGEFKTEGILPPAPYHHIDLFQIIKSDTYLFSKKLEYVADRFLGDYKITNEGITLWIACMKGDAEAWQKMEEYARKDTALLKPLYKLLLPWINVHPNVILYTDNPTLFACDRCASENYTKNGFRYTPTKRFQRYVCGDCGRHFSSRTGINLAATGPVR